MVDGISMRGLPALMRAVPVALFRSMGIRRRRPRADTGRLLLDLITQLPPDLRATALTHSSQVTTRVESNERLEFLGDSVLGLSVAAELFCRHPESEEGELARQKAYVVSRAACAGVAEKLGVGRLMAEQAKSRPSSQGLHKSKAMVGNALEALIGACYLTFGLERTREAVAKAFEEAMQLDRREITDAKTALQELLARRGVQPQYEVVAEDGPAHARVFHSEVSVEGVVRGFGAGTTIKMSEQAAAREALGSYSKDSRTI